MKHLGQSRCIDWGGHHLHVQRLHCRGSSTLCDDMILTVQFSFCELSQNLFSKESPYRILPCTKTVRIIFLERFAMYDGILFKSNIYREICLIPVRIIDLTNINVQEHKTQ